MEDNKSYTHRIEQFKKIKKTTLKQDSNCHIDDNKNETKKMLKKVKIVSPEISKDNVIISNIYDIISKNIIVTRSKKEYADEDKKLKFPILTAMDKLISLSKKFIKSKEKKLNTGSAIYHIIKELNSLIENNLLISKKQLQTEYPSPKKSTKIIIKIQQYIKDLVNEIVFLIKGGSGSIYIFNPSKDLDPVIIKSLNISPYLTKKENMMNLKFNRWRELKVLRWCSELVLNKKTQCLPLFYDSQICNNNKLLLYTEKANGSIKDWCLQNHSEDEWKCLLFHTFYFGLILKNKFQMVHSDLTWSNILFFKDKQDIGKFWKYELDENTFYVPNTGYNYVLWDFGSCQSKKFNPSVEELKLINHRLDINSDLGYFIDIDKRIQMRLLVNRYNLSELKEFIISKEDKKYVDASIEDIKDKMEKYKNPARELIKIHRNVAFYLIEKGLFDKLYQKKISTFFDLSEEYKLVPDNIVKLLLKFRTEVKKQKSEIYKFEDIILPDAIYFIKKYFPEYLKNNNTPIITTFSWK